MMDIFLIESAFKYLHQLNRKESRLRDILGKPDVILGKADTGVNFMQDA